MEEWQNFIPVMRTSSTLIRKDEMHVVKNVTLSYSEKQHKEMCRIWDIINKAVHAKAAKWYRGLGNGVFGQVTECL